MQKRIAAISDIHACYIELEELYNALCWQSLDEIWHIGDVVDRGLDSHKTIQFLVQKNIKGVMGNHCQSIINHWETFCRTGSLPKNPDKSKTIKEINQEDVDYLKTLPNIHVFDDLSLILVHGGLFPNLSLWQQPHNVIRAQMIHPNHFPKSKWFVEDHDGTPEAELRKQGWKAWYELYDFQEDCIYGHTSYYQPKIYQPKGYGKTICIDTGSSFGGSLTACIYSSDKSFYFISVKNKEIYYNSNTRQFWE